VATASIRPGCDPVAIPALQNAVSRTLGPIGAVETGLEPLEIHEIHVLVAVRVRHLTTRKHRCAVRTGEAHLEDEVVLQIGIVIVVEIAQ